MEIQFFIVRKDMHGVETDFSGPYGTAVDANYWAKKMTAEAKASLVPEVNSQIFRVVKRTIVDDQWREREREKFATGKHKPVPWAAQYWAIKDHFTHVSVDDPSKVSYIETPEQGAAGKYTRISPGRYLQKHHPDMLSGDRRYWEDLFKAENFVAELKFAHTESEIEWVYRNGPSSCMTHPAKHFPTGGIHPVRIYAAGDLAVAYITKTDGRVRSRCVCWPEKKIWGRIYGDVAPLVKMLEEHGYKRGSGKWYATHESSLEGSRILYRHLNETNVIAPYLDNPARYVQLDPNSPEYLIVSVQGDATHSNGVAHKPGLWKLCPKCANRKFSIVKRRSSVQLNNGNTAEWCENCMVNYAFSCRYCSTLHELGDRSNPNNYFDTASHGIVCQSCYKKYFGKCALCRNAHLLTSLSDFIVPDSKVCDHCARAHCTKTYCGKFIRKSNLCSCLQCIEGRHHETMLVEADAEDNDKAEIKYIKFKDSNTYWCPGIGWVVTSYPIYRIFDSSRYYLVSPSGDASYHILPDKTPEVIRKDWRIFNRHAEARDYFAKGGR